MQHTTVNGDPISYSVNGTSHTWRAGFMPMYPDEPYMPLDARVRTVTVNCFDPYGTTLHNFLSWKRAATWAWQMHHGRAATCTPITTAVGESTAGLTTPEEKFELLAAHVRDKFRYVAVEIGIGRFQPRLTLETWLNKYGDCKDKVTVLRAMLEAAGIASYPVLARIGDKVDTLLTSPFQFNHVILAVPISSLPGYATNDKARVGDFLYFDPTAESIPVGRIPGALQGTVALRLHETGHELVVLPLRTLEDNSHSLHVEASFGLNEEVIARVRMVERGNLAAETAHWRDQTRVKDHLDVVQSDLAEVMRDPVISDYQYGCDSDSAWEAYSFKAHKYLAASGDMILLKLDPMHPDRKATLKKKDVRRYPISFGRTRSHETTVSWTLPDGYSLSEMPDSVFSETGFGAVESSYSTDGSTVTYRLKAVYNGSLRQPDAYEEAREFERAVTNARAARAILKAK